MSDKSLRQEVADLNHRAAQNESPLDPVVYSDSDADSVTSVPSLAKSSPDAPVYPFSLPLDGGDGWPSDLSCSLRNIVAIPVRAVLESCLVGCFLFLVPASLVLLFTAASAGNYNIFTVRWGDQPQPDFSAVMEFVRMALYAAGMYAIWVLMDAATKMIPLIIRRSWHLLSRPLPNAAKTSLAGWKASRSAINFALFGFVGLVFTDSLVFGSSRLVSSAAQLTSSTISGLSQTWEVFEMALVGLASLSIAFLFQKMVMQLITTSYRKEALAPRVLASNFKFRVLTRLFRQANLGECDARRSIARERAREALHPDDEDLIEISKDIAGLHLTSRARAEEIASALWARICPLSRDYIIQEDLRAFFTPEDVPDVFKVFDLNSTGIINLTTWVEAVVTVWSERCNLLSSIRMSDDTLATLENIINFFIVSTWTLSALGCISPSGYAFIAGIGGFVFGFGFLFKDPCEKVFKSFIFVLVEHPFDIGDTVIVGKIRYTVVDIRLFQTTFKRVSDSTLAYIPNLHLISSYIYNEDRSGITTESLLVTLPSKTSLSVLGTLQASLNTFLSQSYDTFTGSVLIRPLEVQDGQMNVRVECRFQDALSLEKEEKITRKDLLSNRIQNYLKERSNAY